jgi:hypothetical protein
MTGAAGQSAGDVITAVLLQIMQQAERLAALEQREASHRGETAAAQEALRDSLSRLDQQITAIADRLTDFIARGETASEVDDEHGVWVQAPRWWRLDGEEREKAIARLRAWVEQVYRPSYGHLAAALGPCWAQHPLCLFGLHWLMELWSALYLKGGGGTSTLASQAEWQTRLLPALAEQMRVETSRCRHGIPGRQFASAS